MLKVNITGVSHAYEITDNRTTNQTETPVLSGDGAPTLVFVHGWLLSQAYWQPLVEILSTRYRCLTYDLRGFGDSDVAVGDRAMTRRQVQIPMGRTLLETDLATAGPYQASSYSLAAYAQDLATLLSELKIDRAWVLGHSLGGSVALWAAYLFPEQIKGVICINAGGGIYIPKEFEKFRSAGRQMVKFRPDWLTKVPLLPRLFSYLMVKQPLEIKWGQQRIKDFIRAERQAAEGSLLETTSEQEVHLLPQVMGQITQPVHFITATEDTIMPPRYVRYLASFHPHFKESGEAHESVSEIANCGHMAMIEQTESVAAVILNVMASAASSV
ncbi:MAG: alpha/beta hydrolase [Cyanobacteria bacterium J06598_1]